MDDSVTARQAKRELGQLPWFLGTLIVVFVVVTLIQEFQLPLSLVQSGVILVANLLSFGVGFGAIWASKLVPRLVASERIQFLVGLSFLGFAMAGTWAGYSWLVHADALKHMGAKGISTSSLSFTIGTLCAFFVVRIKMWRMVLTVEALSAEVEALRGSVARERRGGQAGANSRG